MGEKKVQLTNFVTAAFSPHVRNSWFPNPGNFCVWNPGTWALESGIQLKESGIPLTKNPESSTLNPKSTARNLEPKTVLDSLTWRMGGGTKRTQERKKMRLDKEDMKISKISLKGKNFRNLITFMRKKKRKIVEKEIAHLHFYFGQCDKMLSNVSSNQRSKL